MATDLTNKKVIDVLQIQFNTILSALKAEADLPANQNEHTFQSIKKIKNALVYNEQVFKEIKDDVIIKNKGDIYIVVRFEKGSVNYGAMSIPISMVVFGYPNSIDGTQFLLTAFSQFFTTYPLGTGQNGAVVDDETKEELSTSTQVWKTPNVFANFNEVTDHFRSIFGLDGVIVMGFNTVNLGTLEYYPNGLNADGTLNETGKETIQFMQIDSSYRAQLGPQPFGNTYGFAKSEVSFSTDSLGIAMYMLDTQLLADLMALKGFVQSNPVASPDPYKRSSRTVNDTFIFKITFSNGFTNYNADDSTRFFLKWKVVQSTINIVLGDIARVSLSITH